MKNMRSLYLVFFVLHLLAGQAQGVLNFGESTHDFGKIDEQNGPVEHTFTFVNSGIEPIRILKVRPSCGCTVPAWTKEEVLPGDTGFVKAKYDPRNRPGTFNKSLTVTVSDESQTKILRIKGHVKPKPKTPAEEYPVTVGNLRMKNTYIDFGKIKTNGSQTRTIDVHNLTDSAIALTDYVIRLPDFLTLNLYPTRLQPDSTGRLEISYDPAKKNDFGYVSDKVFLGESALTVVATIEEYFPEMTEEELERVPKLSISELTYDFGNIEEGEMIKKQFTLENSGKQKLLFRKIKSNCDCLGYTPISKSIKKGKSKVLEVELNTKGLKGNQYKTIAIYSNDPVAPTQMITLKGRVSRED